MALSTKRTCQKRDKKRLVESDITTRLLVAISSSLSKVIRTSKLVLMDDETNGTRAAKRVAKDRQALSHLSDRDLRDIGFTKEQYEDISSALSKRYTEIGFMRQGLRDSSHTKIRRLPKDD